MKIINSGTWDPSIWVESGITLFPSPQEFSVSSKAFTLGQALDNKFDVMDEKIDRRCNTLKNELNIVKEKLREVEHSNEEMTWYDATVLALLVLPYIAITAYAFYSMAN